MPDLPKFARIQMARQRPILCSGPMVRALLVGRKTQTRRPIKKPVWAQHKGWPERVMDEQGLDGRLSWFDHTTGCLAQLPIPQPGDRLWVREAHALTNKHAYRMSVGVDQRINPANYYDAVVYRACFDRSTSGLRWRPSIHMPRWASRLTLTVTDVRVQRVQEISYFDTCAEGVDCETCAAMGQSACYRNGCAASREAFRNLWDSLNAKRGFGWDANPWVYALTFTVHRCNIDEMEKSA